MGARTLREDIEDYPAAIDHLHVEQLLKRALLFRREFVVGDEHIEVCGGLGCLQLLGFARAQVPHRMHGGAALRGHAHHFSAGGLHQGGQFGQRLLGRPADVLVGVERDKEGALPLRGGIQAACIHHPLILLRQTAGYGARPQVTLPPNPGAAGTLRG